MTASCCFLLDLTIDCCPASGGSRERDPSPASIPVRLDRSGDLQGRPGPTRPHHLLWPLRQQPTASTPRLFKSEHILPPLRELAADGIRDRRNYPLTDQDLAAELSTSAVTVKVQKRSASGPDTAGASGPGLAPPPGAARLSGSPGRPTGRGCHRRGRLPTTKASLSGQAPTEPGQPYQQHDPTRSRSTHTTCIPPAGPLPGSGVGRSWSDLVDDRWQDLLGRLEAAANEIEEIELPVERHPTP
jgi:hypothetical protein